MISFKRVTSFCKEDISKIENYDKAIVDKEITWHCHHRDEVKTLPSGMTVVRSVKDLIEADRYYGCPANELIFLTPSEHHRLHAKGVVNPFYGKRCSNETRYLISEKCKGKTWKVINGKRTWITRDESLCQDTEQE